MSKVCRSPRIIITSCRQCPSSVIYQDNIRKISMDITRYVLPGPQVLPTIGNNYQITLTRIPCQPSIITTAAMRNEVVCSICIVSAFQRRDLFRATNHGDNCFNVALIDVRSVLSGKSNVHDVVTNCRLFVQCKRSDANSLVQPENNYEMIIYLKTR